MKKTTMTQIRFKTDTKYGELNDAIYFDPAKPMDDKAIDSEIAKRVSDYEYNIENFVPHEPTKEELEKEIAYLEEQKVVLTAKITKLTAKEQNGKSILGWRRKFNSLGCHR